MEINTTKPDEILECTDGNGSVRLADYSSPGVVSVGISITKDGHSNHQYLDESEAIAIRDWLNQAVEWASGN